MVGKQWWCQPARRVDRYSYTNVTCHRWGDGICNCCKPFHCRHLYSPRTAIALLEPVDVVQVAAQTTGLNPSGDVEASSLFNLEHLPGLGALGRLNCSKWRTCSIGTGMQSHCTTWTSDRHEATSTPSSWSMGHSHLGRLIGAYPRLCGRKCATTWATWPRPVW